MKQDAGVFPSPIWVLPDLPPTAERDLSAAVKREWANRLRVGRLEVALVHGRLAPRCIEIGDGSAEVVEWDTQRTYAAAVQVVRGEGAAELVAEARQALRWLQRSPMGTQIRAARLLLAPAGELEKHWPDMADERWSRFRLVRSRERKTR